MVQALYDKLLDLRFDIYLVPESFCHCESYLVAELLD